MPEEPIDIRETTSIDSGLASVEVENIDAVGAVVGGQPLPVGDVKRFDAPVLQVLPVIALIIFAVGTLRVTITRFVEI